MAGVTAVPTRPRRRLSPAERRSEIVDAACALFARHDPATLTLEEIADAAGVSRALVYTYFGDRNGLLEAVYEHSAARLAATVDAAIASAPSLRDALHAAVRVHVGVAAAEPAIYRHAAGRTPFPRLAELEQQRVDHLAADYGTSPATRLMARGVVSSIHDMVTFWLDAGEMGAEQCVDLVHAFLWGALTGAGGYLGVAFRPGWRDAATPRGA